VTEPAWVAGALRGLARELARGGKSQIITDAGEILLPETWKAVRSTLGDLSMSGWRTGPILSEATIEGSTLILAPLTRARGPMRVLESGRNADRAKGSGTRSAVRGGRISNRNSRWNGRTPAKHTWTETRARLDHEAPEVMLALIVEFVEARIVK